MIGSTICLSLCHDLLDLSGGEQKDVAPWEITSEESLSIDKSDAVAASMQTSVVATVVVNEQMCPAVVTSNTS